MQKHFLLLLLVVGSLLTLKAQNVVGTHELIPGDAPGSYTIKTKVTGLQGVDIARITYLIDDSHTYVASANNAFFSDRNAAHVKFYIMAVPSTGILNIELGVKLSGEGEFVFPVSFQYSKDEQKKSINLPQLNIVNRPVIAAVTPEESETESGSTEPAETGLEEKIRAEEAAAKKAEEEKAAQEEAARKAEEEKAAQEEAARKAEEEKAAQEEAAKKAAEEKAAQEESAKKAAEEKAAQEEAAKKAAEEKAAQEEAAKKAAEEKAAQEAAAKKAAEEKAARKAAEENPVVTSSAKYTVQILSLSEFSSSRLAQYCREHGLSVNDVVKRKVGQWTKISVGEVSSKNEALQIQERLRNQNNISESFIVKLP